MAAYLDDDPKYTREQLGLPAEDNRREFDVSGMTGKLWHCLVRMDGQEVGASVTPDDGILWWEPLATEAESPTLEILHAHDDAVEALRALGFIFEDARSSVSGADPGSGPRTSRGSRPSSGRRRAARPIPG